MQKNERHKKKLSVFAISATMLFIAIGISCKKEKTVLPDLNTTEVIVVTPTSASCTGNVISAGSAKLIEKGFCWSDSPAPTVDDSKTSTYLYPYLVAFELRIGGLNPESTYYVRAYATSEAGTSYGDESSFTTPADLSGKTGTITDVDGNIYPTIGIGSQIWMAENLKTTRYNDGTGIPLVADAIAWSLLGTPAYCWYDNDELNNKDLYGALYNWTAVSTGRLCPSGWHVPSDNEWKVIETFLGGREVAGGKMKETGTGHWKGPNAGATNSSGFNGLPGGRRGLEGSFAFLREGNLFWTSSVNNLTSAWCRSQVYLATELGRGANTILWGGSIRCVRD